MMGNEGSQLQGLELEEKAVEVTSGWTHYAGYINADASSSISVFVSQSNKSNGGSAKSLPAPLERAAKNLMLYRHPCILKFISLWTKNSQFHLATEEVKPLWQVLANQTSLQICIGLHSILKAIVFLHEKASTSHNNVCCSAIYVTPDGTWKLGGLEYLCRFSDLTLSYLQETRAHRYEKAVAPEEDAIKSSAQLAHPSSIDQFAFGVFAEEVLKNTEADSLPMLPEFREVCKKQLQNTEPSVRPGLATQLKHSFFTHSFIKIHSFLEELPLKSDPEKQHFFRSVCSELGSLPEELVASQLGSLLLSRLVLLDPTARQCLLPHVLSPRKDISGSHGLFGADSYREHLVPRLLHMFCVRDAQVRLLLLTHFPSFCCMFTTEQLQTHILPELLVGIKDTNDELVSVTLRALAELVPILGAVVVIGGKRAKLFTDGRPKTHGPHMGNIKNKSPSRKVLTPQHRAGVPAVLVNGGAAFPMDLPERPSPDGGEDHSTTSEEEVEAWSDWDTPDNNEDNLREVEVTCELPQVASLPTSETVAKPAPKSSVLPDISSLDIKNSAVPVKPSSEEIDFFQDMEPIICMAQVLDMEGSNGRTDPSRKFEVNSGLDWGVEGGEWGEGLEDWGEVTEDGNT